MSVTGIVRESSEGPTSCSASSAKTASPVPSGRELRIDGKTQCVPTELDTTSPVVKILLYEDIQAEGTH